MSKTVGIIGGGAAGCLCAYFLLNSGFEVTVYDKSEPLLTLLPTGGGRCNLAHAEFSPKELASNYPRGEKFLYSVFSRFATAETLDLFEKLGIKTYIQEDGRIFPESNSSKEVREVLLKELKRLGCKFVKEEIKDIKTFFEKYQKIVYATGGHNGYSALENLGIKIVESKPSLVGLNTDEKFSELSGTVIKNVKTEGNCGDILFTHFGISGPLIYTISSLKAFEDFPYLLSADLFPDLTKEVLQNALNDNPHKDFKNILSEYLPHKIVNYILKEKFELKAHNVDGKTRDDVLDKIHNFTVTVTGTNKGEETVMAGGVDLDEINPKTMEVKKIPNLYCIGEILNIDGFCGGFNLQNAWSTAYVCAQGIISSK